MLWLMQTLEFGFVCKFYLHNYIFKIKKTHFCEVKRPGLRNSLPSALIFIQVFNSTKQKRWNIQHTVNWFSFLFWLTWNAVQHWRHISMGFPFKYLVWFGLKSRWSLYFFYKELKHYLFLWQLSFLVRKNAVLTKTYIFHIL